MKNHKPLLRRYIQLFVVRSLLQSLPYSWAEWIDIQLKAFTMNNSIFRFTPTEVSESYLIDKPIVALLFPEKRTEFTVIDGNHRLSSYIRFGKNTIKTKFTLPKLSSYFGTLSDFAMYLFYLEIATWGRAIAIGCNTDTIKQISFLPTVKSQIAAF